MHADDRSPDPRRITFIEGVLYNPWVNVGASLVCTAGLGWMTWWFWGMWRDVVDAPAYADQGLDVVGGLIGVIAGGLAMIALFIVTIWVISWWAKRGWGRAPRSES